LKYCICAKTLSDVEAYRQYVTKNQDVLQETLPVKKVVVRKPAKKRKPSARD